MARLIISLLAQSDTAYILSDLAGKAGYAVAAKYAADFESLYERLAVFPDSGHPRPAVGPHVSIGIASPYIHDPRSRPGKQQCDDTPHRPWQAQNQRQTPARRITLMPSGRGPKRECASRRLCNLGV